MSSAESEPAESDACNATSMTEPAIDISSYLNKSLTSFAKIEMDSGRPLAGPNLPMYHLTSAYRAYHYNQAICNLSWYQQEGLHAEEYSLPLNELWSKGYFRSLLLFRLVVGDTMGAVTLDSLQDLAEDVVTKRLNDTQQTPTTVVEQIWYYYAADLTRRDQIATEELTEEDKYHNAFLQAPRNALDRLVAPERGKLRSLDSEADFEAFKGVLFDFEPTTMRSMWDQWRDHRKDWWESLMDLELRVVTRPFRSLVDACRFYHQRTYYGFTYLLDLSPMFDAEKRSNSVLDRSSAKEKLNEKTVLRSSTSETGGPIEFSHHSRLVDQPESYIDFEKDFEAPMPSDFEYDTPRKIDWNTPYPKSDVILTMMDGLPYELTSPPLSPPESPKLLPVDTNFVLDLTSQTQHSQSDLSPYQIQLLTSVIDGAQPSEDAVGKIDLPLPGVAVLLVAIEMG